jgi:hypothetical protein
MIHKSKDPSEQKFLDFIYELEKYINNNSPNHIINAGKKTIFSRRIFFLFSRTDISEKEGHILFSVTYEDMAPTKAFINCGNYAESMESEYSAKKYSHSDYVSVDLNNYQIDQVVENIRKTIISVLKRNSWIFMLKQKKLEDNLDLLESPIIR